MPAHTPGSAVTEQTLVALFEEPTGLFHNLVIASGLDPKTDFRNRDLRGMHFADAEVDGFDFTGSDLRGSGLRFAARFDGLIVSADTKLDSADSEWWNHVKTVALQEQTAHALESETVEATKVAVAKSQTVAQHVPYLRRYARALTGNEGLGDSYVAATLDALVKEPHLLVETARAKVELFRAFSTIWNSTRLAGAIEQGVNFTPADRRLAQIAAMPRQAFLLVSLESFSEDQAAAVLNVDQQTLKELVEESGRQLAAQSATDILIIEDEDLIAFDLENIVEDLGHRTIGVARTRAEAIALSAKKRPGLILADIQLADGSSGIDAVNDLLATCEVPVIFVTAYPERFFNGERPDAAFIISKPYQQSTVSALISQALFFQRNAVRYKSARSAPGAA